MPIEHLTELQYSNDREGPWWLYIYNKKGFHGGGQCFRRPPLQHPDEEITVEKAMNLARVALMQGKEIRVTDAGDFLVYHSKNFECLYPPGGHHGKFWNEIMGRRA